jgi:hypothetical protein
MPRPRFDFSKMIEPKRDIRILPLVQLGLRRCWTAHDHLIRLGVIPLGAMLLLTDPMRNTWVALRASTEANGGGGDPNLALRMLVLEFCLSAVTVMFSVNWLRQLTLGAAAVPGLGLILATRHLRFFFMIFGITVAVILPAMIIWLLLSPLQLLGQLAAIMLAIIGWSLLIARLSPSWIGIAIGAPMPLRVAWQRTAGQGFKLMLAMLMIELPVIFLQVVLEEVFRGVGLIEAAPFTFTLVVDTLELCGIAAQLAVLVSAFPYFLRETV